MGAFGTMVLYQTGRRQTETKASQHAITIIEGKAHFRHCGDGNGTIIDCVLMSHVFNGISLQCLTGIILFFLSFCEVGLVCVCDWMTSQRGDFCVGEVVQVMSHPSATSPSIKTKVTP